MLDERQPSFGQVLAETFRTNQARIYTTLPGVVKSYDADTRTAEVRIGTKAKGADGTVRERPTLQNVRVAFYESGPWEILSDVEAGTEGRLHFSCRSLNVWRQNGGVDRFGIVFGKWVLPG